MVFTTYLVTILPYNSYDTSVLVRLWLITQPTRFYFIDTSSVFTVIVLVFAVSQVVQALEAELASDTTEAACEAACPTILSSIPGGSLVSGLLCRPACKE